MRKPRVLLTGAAGGVAALLLPGLREAYDLTLTDRAPVAGGVGVQGDLADPAFVAEVTRGVDAVVHLAGNPDPTATWDELRIPNVEVVRSVLAAGVPRVVLASSGHAMGQYVATRQVPVQLDWPVAPCCTYGATKAFAEALGAAYAYRTGATVVALRLGATAAEPPASSALGAWLGTADLRQLVLRGLRAEVGFAVCHGMSANTRSDWDLRNAIGYQPTLDSEPYADGVPDEDGWGPCAGPE
jgi:nucleoside-diphosphate-sugar epimerase